jgi:hypothetical protein
MNSDALLGELLQDNQRPVVHMVTDLSDQFAAGAEFHQPRDLERLGFRTCAPGRNRPATD